MNSPSNPARRDSVIDLFGTGAGEPPAEIAVFFQGLPPQFDEDVPPKRGDLLYAGASPGRVPGIFQVKVRVPADGIAVGDAVPLTLIAGSQWTVYEVTVAIR